MNEDPTKDLSSRSFEERVLAELGAIRSDIGEVRSQQSAMARNIASLDQRLTSLESRIISVEKRLSSLEETVDARLKETRPIWEAVQEQIKKLDGKFDLVINDLYEVRLDIRGHERRLTEVENRPS